MQGYLFKNLVSHFLGGQENYMAPASEPVFKYQWLRDPEEPDLFTANQCSLQFLHHLSTVIKDSRKTRFYLQKSF